MAWRITDFRPPRIAQLFVLLAVLLHWLLPGSRVPVLVSPVPALIYRVTRNPMYLGMGAMLFAIALGYGRGRKGSLTAAGPGNVAA